MPIAARRACQSWPRKSISGFTLLEIMIAIVVFSIGLLGIAGLQVAGMRFTQGSQLRAVATMQAESIIDRMRANMAGVDQGFYDISDGTMPAAYAVDCDDPNVVCDPQQLATFDLVVWNSSPAGNNTKESNADVLPAGTGLVCIDDTPLDNSCDNDGDDGFIYAIKIDWSEQSVGEDDAVTGDLRLQRLTMRVIP